MTVGRAIRRGGAILVPCARDRYAEAPTDMPVDKLVLDVLRRRGLVR